MPRRDIMNVSMRRIAGATEQVRRLYIELDGMELEIHVTEQGVKINRNDGGAIAVVPASSNSIEIRKA